MEAKRLAQKFCEAAFGDRYLDVWVFRSYEAWSPWFWDAAWDKTWIIADAEMSRVWLLCVTDTDYSALRGS